MKAIYIQPVTEIVSLQVTKDINWGTYGVGVLAHSPNVAAGNEDHFFDDDEDIDRDAFFDDWAISTLNSNGTGDNPVIGAVGVVRKKAAE